jgi:hypothetical protein
MIGTFTGWIRKFPWLMAAAFLLLIPIYALATETSKKADLDGDGIPETTLFYDGKLITRAVMDENDDGKPDGTVYYKAGFRYNAERDLDFDGKNDTWVKYYMTGVPWMVMRDKNGDGKPDYWKHIKNGFVYKREWDRNLDGKPDIRMIVPGKADLRDTKVKTQLLEKHFDNDYDGNFEKVVKVRKREPSIKVQNQAGAIGEY